MSCHRMLLHFVLIFVLNFATGQIYQQRNEIISDYLKKRHINFVTFYLNGDLHEISQLTKSLQENNIRYRIFGHETNQSSGVIRNIFHVNVVDMNNNHDRLIKIINNDPLTIVNKWLIFTDNLNKFEKFSLQLRTDSDVTIAYATEHQEILYDAYQSGNSQNRLLRIGYWKNTSGISFLQKYYTRRNMNDTTVKVVTFFHTRENVCPESYLKDFHNKHQDNAAKINYELLILLQQIHNFSIKLMVVKNEDQLMEYLQNGKADLALTPGSLNQDVIKTLDVLPSTYRYRTAFIFRNPGDILGANEFLAPLGADVWYATLGSTLVVIILLRIAFVFDNKLNQDDTSEIVRINCEEGKEWSAVICDTFSMLIQQGTTYEPVSMSGRLILFVYLSLAVLLYNYYTSIMVSNLLSAEPPKFNGLKELGLSKINLGMQNSSLILSSFEASTNLTIKHIYNHKMVQNGTSRNLFGIEDGVLKVNVDNFALYAHTDAAYFLIKKSFELSTICDVNAIEVFKPTDLFMFASKDSQFKKLFDISYRKLIERGVYRHVTNKWLTLKPPCLAIRDVRQVSGGECLPLYGMLLCGYVLSIIFVIFENFHYVAH